MEIAMSDWKFKFTSSLVILILCALPQLSAAVGLGALKVSSHLNEPLSAQIALSGIKADELNDLRVRLADDASFERAGLNRSYLLTQLKFTTKTLSNGRSYIQVSSRESVREPGLSFIVSLVSQSASHERRYDVLLNLR